MLKLHKLHQICPQAAGCVYCLEKSNWITSVEPCSRRHELRTSTTGWIWLAKLDTPQETPPFFCLSVTFRFSKDAYSMMFHNFWSPSWAPNIGKVRDVYAPRQQVCGNLRSCISLVQRDGPITWYQLAFGETSLRNRDLIFFSLCWLLKIVLIIDSASPPSSNGLICRLFEAGVPYHERDTSLSEQLKTFPSLVIADLLHKDANLHRSSR